MGTASDHSLGWCREPGPTLSIASAPPLEPFAALQSHPVLLNTPPMLAKVCSAAVNGIESYPVEVEVNAGYGDPIIVIIVSISPSARAVRRGMEARKSPWNRARTRGSENRERSRSGGRRTFFHNSKAKRGQKPAVGKAGRIVQAGRFAASAGGRLAFGAGAMAIRERGGFLPGCGWRQR
jgi:hypothetical protein